VLEGQTWTTYTTSDGLADDTVQAVAIEPVIGDFAVDWHSTNRNFPFDLTLVQEGTQLKGWHCATVLDASRTDCVEDDNPEPSVEGNITGNTATLRFVSGYSNAAGQATLIDSGDSLTWHITESPTAEFYLPQQATLFGRDHNGPSLGRKRDPVAAN
jgi:hypothetical protein